MMPGETHPAAPGPADLARCQGCASLQQNLNEYVEALIALKQKIINTDNLLTEYQKKCDDILHLFFPLDVSTDSCVITQKIGGLSFLIILFQKAVSVDLREPFTNTDSRPFSAVAMGVW